MAMKYDVFISYSSLDQKVAEGVCAYLEQHRIRCFIAYRDIPKGVVWAKYIVEALDESRMMVVVFSGNLNCSEQVDREIELASESRKPILTFRISNENFKGAKKYYLKNLNWIDAFPQPEKCFGTLCENVKRLLDNRQETIEKNNEVIIHDYAKEFDKNPTEAKAQADLAWHYYEGNGVKKDFSMAFYWCHKAAEQGYLHAQCNLGTFYMSGIGVEKDLSKAVYWLRKAAEQGYAEAQYNLGWCYYNEDEIKNSSQAAYWLLKAAEQGSVEAQSNLGWCYYNGIDGEKDLSKAVYWYRKAAEQGYALSQYNLATFYQSGNGIGQDLTQAIYWYKKAAKQGYADAQKELRNLGETW